MSVLPTLAVCRSRSITISPAGIEEKDIAFIARFVDTMANAKRLPVERTIPDNMKEKLDIYLCRKRDDKK